MDDFIMPSILQATSLPQETLDSIDKSATDWTFLHACAAVSRDPSFIKYELMSIMLAGRDTVSSTLTWTLIELARNPKLMMELRHEIAELIGVGWQAPTPTLSDLKQMKLVSNTLNETLRLYPTVSLNLRCALRDTSLPRGGGLDGAGPVGVEAGTPIIFSSQILRTQPLFLFLDSANMTTDLSSDTYDSDTACTSPDMYDPHRWESWSPKPGSTHRYCFPPGANYSCYSGHTSRSEAAHEFV